MSSSISASEESFIIQGCQENCRQDGRKRSEFRNYSIVVEESSSSSSSSSSSPLQGGDSNNHTEERNGGAGGPPLILSNGSARLFLATGETHIMVSAKAELVVPSVHRPSEGTIDIHVDMMTKESSNKQHQIRDEEQAFESTLGSLLVPHLVDVSKLCIVPHHYVWSIQIDLLILASSGGSLLDACSLAVVAALETTKLPFLHVVAATTDDDKHNNHGSSSSSSSSSNKPTLQVDRDLSNAQSIPGIQKGVSIVTVSMLQPQQAATTDTKRSSSSPILVLDATQQEEACAFCRVHIVLVAPHDGFDPDKLLTNNNNNNKRNNYEPTICALHKAGGGSIPFSWLQEVTNFVLQSTTNSQNNNANSITTKFSNQGHYHMLQDSFLVQQ